jgi:hypothetical protein
MHPRYSHTMDLPAIIEGLRDERGLIEQAIMSFERLAAGQGKRRGRPPAWMKHIHDMPNTAKRRRGRPPKADAKPTQ